MNSTVFPDLSAYTKDHEVLFAFEHEIAGALSEAKRRDSDAWHLAKAANIIRKDMLKVKNAFNGTFNDDGLRNSVPESLKTLAALLLKGPTADIDPNNNQACLTVSQLILFNCATKHCVKPDSKGNTHHVKFLYRIYSCISRPFTTKKSAQKIALDLYTSHTQRPDQAVREICITTA